MCSTTCEYKRQSVGPAALDDRRPARDLALDQGGKGLLAASRLVREHASQLEQSFARQFVVERLVERIAELIEDGLGCVFRGEERVPGLGLEFGQAGFLAGGHARQRRAALGRADGIGLDLAALHLLHEIDDLVAHVVDLTGD